MVLFISLIVYVIGIITYFLMSYDKIGAVLYVNDVPKPKIVEITKLDIIIECLLWPVVLTFLICDSLFVICRDVYKKVWNKIK